MAVCNITEEDFLYRVSDLGHRIFDLLEPYRGQPVTIGFEVGECEETDHTALVYIGVLVLDDMDLRRGFTLSNGLHALYCFNIHDPTATKGADSWCFRSYESILAILVPYGDYTRQIYERLET